MRNLNITLAVVFLLTLQQLESVRATSDVNGDTKVKTKAEIHAQNLRELASSLSRNTDDNNRNTAKYLCEAESNCGGIIFNQQNRDYDEDHSEDEEYDEDYDEDYDEELEYTKLFTVPLHHFDENSDNVFISTKPWLIQRGAVNIPAYALSSTIIHTDHNITIEEARAYCQYNTDCIAFTFPLQSQHSLNTVDEVIYVNRIAEFDYGPEHYIRNGNIRNGNIRNNDSDKDSDSDSDKDSDKDDTANDNENEESFIPDIEWMTHIIHDRQRLMGKIPKTINLDKSKWSAESSTPYRPCCSSSTSSQMKLPTIEELKNADSLERVDCSISRTEFFEKYEKPRKPVILVGCTKDWKANDLWSSFDQIQSRFDNDSKWEFQSISRDVQTNETIPATHKTGTKITWGEFQEFYAKVKEDPDFGSIRMFRKLNVGEYVTDELRKDYTPPKVFDDANLYAKTPRYGEHWFPKNFGLMGYFIMGSYGTGTGPHADPLTTDAWSTLLTGHKWWLVYPKLPGVIDQTETQCSSTCSNSESNFHGTGSAETMAWYSSVAKHANKFYYGNGEHTRHVLQKPGETIYIPHGMVHSVMNMEETIAITEKFASEANLEEVWREILKSGEDYDWPHLYYKVFNETQRQIVRNIVWPITKESIERVTDNTYLYTRKPPNKSWVRNEEDYDEEDYDEEDYDEEDYDEEDYDDEEYFEEEEDFLRLSLEEYDDLTINEKHMYVDKLGYYFDFDPALVRPSEYESMTEEEREEYDSEMRWMASPEFETYLRFEDLDDDEIEALSSEEKELYMEMMTK